MKCTRGKLPRFLKMVELVLGHSLIITKWNWGVFFPKIANWPLLWLSTRGYAYIDLAVGFTKLHYIAYTLSHAGRI